jgi:hypothetical protein
MPHPIYLGWQVDWPLFVKVPFGDWKRFQHYNWIDRDIAPERVASLYASGFLHHNKALEGENKVGDRLNEMTIDQLDTLVNLINAKVKDYTNSVKEFNDRRCKKSRILDKQRGLIRRFLYSNSWITNDFYKYRDQVLGE